MMEEGNHIVGQVGRNKMFIEKFNTLCLESIFFESAISYEDKEFLRLTKKKMIKRSHGNQKELTEMVLGKHKVE